MVKVISTADLADGYDRSVDGIVYEIDPPSQLPLRGSIPTHNLPPVPRQRVEVGDTVEEIE